MAGIQYNEYRMSADYQSHYNTKMRRCLMAVQTMDSLGPSGKTGFTEYLVDPIERRL